MMRFTASPPCFRPGRKNHVLSNDFCGVAIVEKLHTNWTFDRDYLAAPTRGKLVSLDPGLLVTSPKGLEVGMVLRVDSGHQSHRGSFPDASLLGIMRI
jgi:hypothetical protein